MVALCVMIPGKEHAMLGDMTRFASILFTKLPSTAHSSEPFSALPYAEEVRAKNEALSQFWKEASLPGAPLPLVEAPVPRGYRTTTKRRVALHGNLGVSLGFSEQAKPRTCVKSLLEPDSHNRIYAFLFEKLSTPAYKPLARALSWVIVRGSHDRHCLILNVEKMDATVVRKTKLLAEHLLEAGLGITSAMMYADPTRSDYYLTAERPQQGLDVKHLFGPRLLTLVVNDRKLKYPPTVFSQVNEAMVPTMVTEARRMLGIKGTDRFLDLYCGYGLFSFTMGEDARETFGIELEGEAIACARETARRRNQALRFRFVAARIRGESLSRVLPQASREIPEVMLLDPPRRGAEPGVIDVLAARKPRRVLHICCGTDEMIPTISTWIKYGFKVEQVKPLDLFAGCANLETLISLVPACPRHAE